MTRPTIPPSGLCKQAPDRTSCPMACKYNHYHSDEDDLTIDAWELKCLECGWRDTIGFRSDEPDPDAPAGFDPKVCPFCSQKNLQPGKNPCETCDKG